MSFCINGATGSAPVLQSKRQHIFTNAFVKNVKGWLKEHAFFFVVIFQKVRLHPEVNKEPNILEFLTKENGETL